MSGFPDEQPFNYLDFIYKFRASILEELAVSNYESLDLYKQVVGRRMALDDLIKSIETELDKRKKKFQ